jgi:hypothetical protein
MREDRMTAMVILGVWLFGSVCFAAGWAVSRRLQAQVGPALGPADRPEPGDGLWGDSIPEDYVPSPRRSL